MLYVGWMGRMGQMGLGWMVIIGHRSSKSTFGANKETRALIACNLLLVCCLPRLNDGLDQDIDEKMCVFNTVILYSVIADLFLHRLTCILQK